MPEFMRRVFAVTVAYMLARYWTVKIDGLVLRSHWSMEVTLLLIIDYKVCVVIQEYCLVRL
jgi:hypothetical protein